MGRVKLEIKKIQNTTNRQVTFSKRRNGIIKKAYELSVLCDIDLALIMFSPSGRLSSFSGKRRVEDVLEKYVNYDPDNEGIIHDKERLLHTIKKLQCESEIVPQLSSSEDPQSSHGKIQKLHEEIKDLKEQLKIADRQLHYFEPDPSSMTTLTEFDTVENSLLDTLALVLERKKQLTGDNNNNQQPNVQLQEQLTNNNNICQQTYGGMANVQQQQEEFFEFEDPIIPNTGNGPFSNEPHMMEWPIEGAMDNNYLPQSDSLIAPTGEVALTFDQTFGDLQQIEQLADPMYQIQEPVDPTFQVELQVNPTYHVEQQMDPTYHVEQQMDPTFQVGQQVNPAFPVLQQTAPTNHVEQQMDPTFQVGRQVNPTFQVQQQMAPTYNVEQQIDPTFQVGRQVNPTFQVQQQTAPTYHVEQQMDPTFQVGGQVNPAFQVQQQMAPTYNVEQQMDPTFQFEQMDPTFRVEQMDPTFQVEQLDPTFQVEYQMGTTYHVEQQMDPTFQNEQQMDPRHPTHQVEQEVAAGTDKNTARWYPVHSTSTDLLSSLMASEADLATIPQQAVGVGLPTMVGNANGVPCYSYEPQSTTDHQQNISPFQGGRQSMALPEDDRFGF